MVIAGRYDRRKVIAMHSFVPADAHDITCGAGPNNMGDFWILLEFNELSWQRA
jgi:hypothetical protein